MGEKSRRVGSRRQVMVGIDDLIPPDDPRFEGAQFISERPMIEYKIVTLLPHNASNITLVLTP
jgi:hypothetical protein